MNMKIIEHRERENCLGSGQCGGKELGLRELDEFSRGPETVAIFDPISTNPIGVDDGSIPAFRQNRIVRTWVTVMAKMDNGTKI